MNMQKREHPKIGGTTTPSGKRGRPVGGGNNASVGATNSTPGDSAAPSTLLGPSLQVHSAFAEQNNRRIVLALQSGLKSEITWALNALTLLSFKEKDDVRKDATPLAKIPGLLDALLQVIDDWRDISLSRVLVKKSRLRTLGTDSAVNGFGNEYEALNSSDSVPQPNAGSGSTNKEVSLRMKPPVSGWWCDEYGIFNLDEEGRAEKQLCAVAASNIIRNFSFMTENEIAMAQNRHCIESMFRCLENHATEDEEIVTNALETIMNMGPLLDFRIFSSSKPSYVRMTEKQAIEAIMSMLGSSVKAWHCAVAELLGRLILNPDNEQFLLPFSPQIYKRLVDLLSFPGGDAQAASVGALYNFAEVNMDSRLKLANEKWAVDRLLKVIKTPHPMPEICRKAALVLENLALEPQNKQVLIAYENAFADLLFSETRYADTFARILYELTSRPSSRPPPAQAIWGM